MWTRSEAAFRFSASRLFDLYDPIYFWTFTTSKVHCDWHYSSIWGRFVNELSNLYGGTLHGLKVIELHKDHGIHFHALLNKRIWSGEVWRVAKRYGIGWLSAKRADMGAVDYLAAYLGKEWRSEHKTFGRLSRWGMVGGFRGCRCKDVEIDSPFHAALRVCQEALSLDQMPFVLVKAIEQRPTDDPEELRAAMARFRSNGGTISGLWGGRLSPSRSQVDRHLRALKR